MAAELAVGMPAEKSLKIDTRSGRLTVMLPSGQVLQQVGDADDRTEAGERLTDPHAVAVAPGCRSVVVPELSKRVARFTLTAPERRPLNSPPFFAVLPLRLNASRKR